MSTPPAQTSIEDQGVVSTRNLILHCFKCVNAGQVDRAAKFYSSCQEDIGYQMISAMPANPKFRRAMAKMFYTASDYEKSAVIMENLKDYDRAAQLYEKDGNYPMAAELYVRVEKKEKAASMFEKSGQFDWAAKLYSEVEIWDRAAINFEKAVNNYLAGQMYYKLGNVNKALDTLQRVDQKDEKYLEAVTLIGQILVRNKYTDLAMKKYQTVLKSWGVVNETLAVAYDYALLLEQLGKIDQARDLLNRILEINFQYKDAAERVKTLGSGHNAVLGADEDDVEELEEIDLEDDVGTDVPSETDEEALNRVHNKGSQADIVGIMEGFEFLRQTPLFADLSLSEMKAFYNICTVRTFKPGEIIIEQGVQGTALYVVKKGKIAVQKVGGKEVKTLVELAPGVHVGEMSLVDEDALTSARVTAVEDPTEMFEISRENFEKLMFANDKIALKLNRVFIHTLAERLRNTSNELAQVKAEMAQLPT